MLWHFAPLRTQSSNNLGVQMIFRLLTQLMAELQMRNSQPDPPFSYFTLIFHRGEKENDSMTSSLSNGSCG